MSMLNPEYKEIIEWAEPLIKSLLPDEEPYKSKHFYGAWISGQMLQDTPSEPRRAGVWAMSGLSILAKSCSVMSQEEIRWYFLNELVTFLASATKDPIAQILVASPELTFEEARTLWAGVIKKHSV